MEIRTQKDCQNYGAIDLAKFICAILVVMIHVAPFDNADSGTFFACFNFGVQKYIAKIAVPFFFTASGFFLYRKTTFPSFDIRHSKKYIFRIMKLYIIWSIIYLPLSIYGFFKNENGFLLSIANYIRKFIFVGSYTHLWYLNGLIIAVLVSSFLLYKKVKPINILFIAFGLHVVGLLGQTYFGIILPLKEFAPFLWETMRFAGKIISTTRNGLFFGFLFVSIGMIFAFYDISISKTKSLVLFLISMLILFAEVHFQEKNNYSRGSDMFLFSIPAAFFLFAFIKQIHLSDRKIFKTLRIMSSLLFYTHLWIDFIVSRVIKIIGINSHNSPVRFFAVLIISLGISYVIYYTSNKEQTKMLRKLFA